MPSRVHYVRQERLAGSIIADVEGLYSVGQRRGIILAELVLWKGGKTFDL